MLTTEQINNEIRLCPYNSNSIERNNYLSTWTDTINNDDNKCLFFEQQQNINYPRRHDDPTDDIMNYSNNLPLSTRHTLRPRIKEFFNDNSKLFYNPYIIMNNNHEYDDLIYDEPAPYQSSEPSMFSLNNLIRLVIIALILYMVYYFVSKRSQIGGSNLIHLNISPISDL